MFVHPVSGTQTFQSDPRNLQRVIDWAERGGNRRSIMPNYDAIIIGTGQSGPALARRLVARRPEGRDHRTQAVRRYMREHRLYSH